MRRYRLGIPTLLIAGAYAIAVAVTAVLALSGGDIGFLWRLTLFYEADDDVSATWQNVLVLVLTGAFSAWALWQSLRGPVAGARPEIDRGVRWLRVALYAAVGWWLLYAVLPVWPWWAVVIDSLVLAAVAALFHPVLQRTVRLADLARAAGVLGHLSVAAGEVFDTLDWRDGEWSAAIAGFGGLARLFWVIMVFVSQRRDGRFQRATVWYGIGYLLLPVLLLPVSLLLRLAGGFDDVAEEVAYVPDILLMVWLARSAHDLADPHARPAPSPPLLAVPPAFAVGSRLSARAGFAACAVLLVPAVVNLFRGHSRWITAHVPATWLAKRVGDVAATLWWVFESFAGIGGLAVVVLFALCRGTRLTFLAAMGALLLTAAAGTAGLVVFLDSSGPAIYRIIQSYSGDPFASRLPISPLWFIAACACSAVLLWWAHTVRPRLDGTGLGRNRKVGRAAPTP
ncbi:hypothetical protein ACFLIM_33495 [Nonomuraea sp. M3C6]|uniref:Uncharacterized protein n=1 Tax=Nonomuraea marmarensis TaxID=3351344 RepID=A0ABW7ALA6_9ACTN